MTELSRRAFLKKMGKTSIMLSAAPAFSLLNHCAHLLPPRSLSQSLGWIPIKKWGPPTPNQTKGLLFSKDFPYRALFPWHTLSSQDPFLIPSYNQMLFLPYASPHSQAMLWITHAPPPSSITPLLPSPPQKTLSLQARIFKEQKTVGATLFYLKKTHSTWNVQTQDPRHFQITAQTPIPIQSPRPILGRIVARGTIDHGGTTKTSWGSILSGEMHWEPYYGKVLLKNNKRVVDRSQTLYSWHRFYSEPPEHYGWVLEINPKKQLAKKLISLGRFAHQSIFFKQNANHTCTVYMKDDHPQGCLYKFVSTKPYSLKEGTLYVANIKKGQWIALDLEKNPLLKPYFHDSVDLLIRTREAALLAHATPLPNTQALSFRPDTQTLWIQDSHPNSLLVLHESEHTPFSFQTQYFHFENTTSLSLLTPENLLWDFRSQLWITANFTLNSQIKYNGLFLIPTQGPYAKKLFQIGSAPKGMRFSGMSFSSDRKTVFLNLAPKLYPPALASNTLALSLPKSWTTSRS